MLSRSGDNTDEATLGMAGVAIALQQQQPLPPSTVTSITLVNTQNVSVTKIVDSSSIQCAESKYGLRIQFLALVVMAPEVWLNA
jgi:hypothetical protein